MKRYIKVVATVTMLCVPSLGLAFCGGWDSPVAPGFNAASWAEKWPVLGMILVFVGVFSTLILRRVSTMRAMPDLEA